jgi:hypothetical protein
MEAVMAGGEKRNAASLKTLLLGAGATIVAAIFLIALNGFLDSVRLREEHKALCKEVEAIQVKVDKTEESAAGNNGRVGVIETKIGSIESQLISINRKIDTLIERRRGER